MASTRVERTATATRTSTTRRWLRGGAITVIVLLAVTGGIALVRTFTAGPGVGHFTSVEARDTYTAAYDEAMALMPPPTGTIDLPTSHGTVRITVWRQAENASGAPVLLVPGRASGTPMWLENLPAFASNREVISFDLLGDAGMSAQSAPVSSMREQSAWITEVVQRIAPQGVHLVGHSFGGATAADFALHQPQLVHSLTLLEPVLTLAPMPADAFFWATVATLPFVPQSWRDHALGRVGGVEHDGDDPMARMIEAAASGYSAALPTPTPLSDDALASLTMPVYVAIAERDSLAGGDSAADRAEQILPNATVRVWADTTHSLPMQVATPLGDELRAFWVAAD